MGVFVNLVTTDGVASCTITTDNAQKSTHITYRITGINTFKLGEAYAQVWKWNPTYQNGTSTNANPPSITPGLGQQNYLYLTGCAIEGTIVASAAPTDFSGLTTKAGASDSASISTAYRNYSNSSAYDPGTFTTDSGNWIAMTAVIYPIVGHATDAHLRKDVVSLQPFHTTYQTIYNAMTTKPTGKYAWGQNDMVKKLVDDGIWAKLDWFWVAATETNDNGEALINWKNPGTDTPTNPTSTAWTALEGFTGDNSSDYIDTNFNPSTDSTNFSQNSACVGCYVRNNYNENKPAMSCSTTCSIFPRSSGSIYGRVNSTASATWAVADSTGLTVVCRTSSTNLTAYRDGSSLGNVNNSSTAPSNADFEILSMSALPYYGRYQVAIAFIGGVLDDTENTNLYNAINAYMTRIGKNV
jgi:hypothetical protein